MTRCADATRSLLGGRRAQQRRVNSCTSHESAALIPKSKCHARLIRDVLELLIYMLCGFGHIVRMSKPTLLAVSAAMLLTSTGCFRAVVTAPVERSPVEESSTGVAVFGVTPTTHKASECKHGLAKVDSSMPFWGSLVWLVTGGIIAPISAEYTCAAPPKAEVAP